MEAEDSICSQKGEVACIACTLASLLTPPVTLQEMAESMTPGKDTMAAEERNLVSTVVRQAPFAYSESIDLPGCPTAHG